MHAEAKQVVTQGTCAKAISAMRLKPNQKPLILASYQEQVIMVKAC